MHSRTYERLREKGELAEPASWGLLAEQLNRQAAWGEALIAKVSKRPDHLHSG